MKNNTYRWMVLLWVLIHSTLSFAYDVEVNGIYYNLNTNLRKAEVTNGTTKYRGIVDIPATINDGGTTYSVTNIGKSAFEGCYSLTSVTIPNGVTTIDNYAFSGCTGMTSITIPNSVTNFIGSYVFNGCSGLASIHVESGNTIYDSRGDCNAIIETSTNTLKFGCKNTIIPNSVTTIGECAFNSCTGLTSITIPSSVTKFNSYAFWQCSGLTAVHITDLAAWYKISFSVYSNPLQYAHHLYLNGKEVKDLVIPSSVTTIGSYVFEGCVGLTSVTIPNSITSIEESAFASCSGLTQVTIPNSVTYIGRAAFSHCSGLTQVTIPNSVTNIGSYAFNSCTRLASVTIPCNVSAIGDVAFYGCSKMNFVKSEIESPFGISDKVFGNISSNATLQVPKGTKSKYEELSSWTTNFQTIIEDENSGPTTFTLSITASGNGSVSYNSTSVRNNMQSFTVNSGTSATVSFSPDTGYRIASVKVNNTDVTSSVANNKYTINNITANTTMEVVFGEEINTVTIDNITYNLNHNEKTAEVTSGTNGYSGKFVIPATINSNGTTYSVTGIGSEAFKDCSGLTLITIPNSVTSIGSYAFYKCSGLTSMTIPNSVTNIGRYAFSGCSGLTSTTIPNNVKSIGESTFSRCSKLTSITIPNSVTSIGDYAFSSCSGLTSVTIPNSVTSIGDCTFQFCSGLTSVTISNSVTKIGENAFAYCSGLTAVHISDLAAWCNISFYSTSSNPLWYAHHLFLNGSEIEELVIPSSVTSIGKYAFSGCSGLTSLTIPNSVTSIGESTFGACSNLSSVTIPNSVTAIRNYAFEQMFKHELG